MEPQKKHAPMNPNEAAAALSIATRISENAMRQMRPPKQEQEVQEETPQANQEAPEPENEEIKMLQKDLAEMKGNLEGVINTKFDELKKTITDAIAD